MQENFANQVLEGVFSCKTMLYSRAGNFREFPKIREIRENFMHAKICCSTVRYCSLSNHSTSKCQPVNYAFYFCPIAKEKLRI